jgi:hypothetical protein
MVIGLRKRQGKPTVSGATKPHEIRLFQFPAMLGPVPVYIPFIAKLKPPFKTARP